MAKLKWFSGGKERREEAISIIEELISDLQTNDSAEALSKLLTYYLNEFKTKRDIISFSYESYEYRIDRCRFKKQSSPH